MAETGEILQGVRDALTVGRVFGEPIEREGATIIPVVSVRGCGHGGRERYAEGGSGGCFCVKARPAGVYIVRDSEVKWRPATDPSRVLCALAAAALVVFALRRR